MSEPIILNPVQFEACEDDHERFEFAQYIVNTPPEDRPEVTEADAQEALDWYIAASK